mmetsp:Transcript_32713/g.90254  ORF Transcript_32713/g.90254 Transcript_32713/m.90254 type:complete len:384 (+) Transcript_32713:57-1208(+)
MAPKREIASGSYPSRAAKKLRASPVDAKCKQVIDGLRESALPEVAFQPLAAAVGNCLGVVREERHAFQERVIDAIADIFGKTDARLEKAIANARAASEEIQTKISACEAEAEGAAAKLDALQGEKQAHKLQLASDAQAFQAAKATLEQKVVAQTHGLNELLSAEQQKAEVESLAKEIGTVHEASNKVQACEELVKRMLKHVGIDESMRTAIPCTLTKAPSALGSFDKMVIEQLNDSVSKRIEKLDEMIASTDQVKEALAKDVSAAEMQNEVAKKKQMASARAFIAAADKVNAAEEAHKGLLKDVSELKKQLRTSDRQVGEAEANSELFKDGPLAALAFLRERSTPCTEPSGDVALDATDVAMPLEQTPPNDLESPPTAVEVAA